MRYTIELLLFLSADCVLVNVSLGGFCQVFGGWLACDCWIAGFC